MADSYRGVPFPSGLDTTAPAVHAAWIAGVNDALDSRADVPTDSGALKITGWTRDVVRAFAHLTQDDPDTARRIVRDLSGANRAVLHYWAAEVSRIAEEEDRFRCQADRTRARDSHPDTVQI